MRGGFFLLTGYPCRDVARYVSIIYRMFDISETLKFQSIHPFSDFFFRRISVEHAAFYDFCFWRAGLEVFGGLAKAAAA